VCRPKEKKKKKKNEKTGFAKCPDPTLGKSGFAECQISDTRQTHRGLRIVDPHHRFHRQSKTAAPFYK